MNLSSVTFYPKAWVVLEPKELELLAECSLKHYDSVCVNAGKPGGFLFGMVNVFFASPNEKHQLSWRELDTLAKIAEQSQFMGLEKSKRGLGLQLTIRKILATLEQLTPPEVADPVI